MRLLACVGSWVRILEVSPGTVPIQLCRRHKVQCDGGAFTCQLTAGEERHGFLPTAQGRIWFSQWLLSTGTLPSRRFSLCAAH